ncbi:MAG: DNA polymerase/3'-5' exonuclease PolX [Gammaproteobacteria bacterium]|nr:DNA polymerase/3'-5' exonuclease PolX [Gammaproteobacteria bacterium]
MPVHNRDIAEQFSRLADLLEVEGANPFRVRAYRNAARTVGSHSRGMAEMLEQGEDLTRLPGIGQDLAGKIRQIVDTGHLPLLDKVAQRTPPALSELMHIEGLGPKRMKALYEALEIRSLADLKQAVDRQQVRELAGFGAKTEAKIGRGIERLAGSAARTKLMHAEQIAAPLVAWLKDSEGVKAVEVAGSFRRRQETVGDLDILVTASRSSDVMERFVRYDEVAEAVSQGKTRSTVRLRSGLQVDLRVVPEVAYGAALYYFTGSKDHNVAVRKLALKRQLKINEYGVFKGDERVAGRTEKAVFDSVGLPFIPPELRENRGEIEAASMGRLPVLVELDDIRGDLHCHTNATDGHHSLEQMARAAQELGYEYLAISDHSRHVSVAHGLDSRRLEAQIAAIDRLNEKLGGLVLLKSAEVDILEDGSLDLPDAVLTQLDFTVCAVHYKFDLSRKRQTERVLRAMDNPHFNILAHPTGRLINEREPYDIDLEQIMQAAMARGCFLELNAHPDRLDLNDAHCKLARDIGLKLAVSTDAHSTSDLEFMRYGIGQARRGWLQADDVLNTRSLNALKKLLRRS